MERLRATLKDLRGEAPFVVLIAIIYFGGVLLYQAATTLAPEMMLVRSVGVEMVGFTLTLLVARWWFSRAFLTAPNHAAVEKLTQELEALRQEVDDLRDALPAPAVHDRRIRIIDGDPLDSARLRLSDDQATRNEAIVNLGGELIRLLVAQAGTGLLTRFLTPGARHNGRTQV
jgi:hypothetical protein